MRETRESMDAVKRYVIVEHFEEQWGQKIGYDALRAGRKGVPE
ncbi:6535_t:CDS:2, partial [Acaulospora morrowiae]